MDSGKVAAVTNWTQTATVKELQSFLGLANYYNQYVTNFAALAAPLMDLLQKHKAFTWGPQQDAAFVAIKTALTCTPVLAFL